MSIFLLELVWVSLAFSSTFYFYFELRNYRVMLKRLDVQPEKLSTSLSAVGWA